MDKLIGKDGRSYDDYWALQMGNKEYERRKAEQEKQNKLLEEQNKLLKQQEKNKLDIEREKIATNIRMQEMQIEHEEKMRILKLFDDAELNSSTYKDFIYYLFGDNPINIKNKLIEYEYMEDDLKDDIDNINTELKDIKSHIKKIMPDYDEKNILKENLEKYINNTATNEERFKVENYLKTEDRLKPDFARISTRSGIISLSIFVILIFIAVFFNIPIWLVGVGGILVSIISRKLLDFKPLANTALSYINSTLDSEVHSSEETLYKIKEDSEKKLKEIKKFHKELKNILPKWNDFVEFRKKHYNSKIENILIETGVKDAVLALDFEYPKINAKNKKGDGTIEDYIAYFEDVVSDEN